MIPEAGKILCVIMAATLCMGISQAQSRSAGCTFCFAGVGISYEHQTDDDSFIEMQLRTETYSMFRYGELLPGISASFTWNMVFARAEVRNGSIINFFAGPGIAAGFCDDVKARNGMYFGLKGRIGGECTFPRRVTISIALAPVLGAHVGKSDGTVNMLPYKLGLAYCIMPEVGIKYAF